MCARARNSLLCTKICVVRIESTLNRGQTLSWSVCGSIFRADRCDSNDDCLARARCQSFFGHQFSEQSENSPWALSMNDSMMSSGRCCWRSNWYAERQHQKSGVHSDCIACSDLSFNLHTLNNNVWMQTTTKSENRTNHNASNALHSAMTSILHIPFNANNNAHQTHLLSSPGAPHQEKRLYAISSLVFQLFCGRDSIFLLTALVIRLILQHKTIQRLICVTLIARIDFDEFRCTFGYFRERLSAWNRTSFAFFTTDASALVKLCESQTTQEQTNTGLPSRHNFWVFYFFFIFRFANDPFYRQLIRWNHVRNVHWYERDHFKIAMSCATQYGANFKRFFNFMIIFRLTRQTITEQLLLRFHQISLSKSKLSGAIALARPTSRSTYVNAKHILLQVLAKKSFCVNCNYCDELQLRQIAPVCQIATSSSHICAITNSCWCAVNLWMCSRNVQTVNVFA